MPLKRFLNVRLKILILSKNQRQNVRSERHATAPKCISPLTSDGARGNTYLKFGKMVGPEGLEPPTKRL